MAEAPDPNFLQQSWQWMAGIIGALAGGWKYVDARLERKATKEELAELLKRIDKSNEHIEKLYSNAERDRERMSDGFSAIKDDMHDKFDALKTIIMEAKK